MNKSFNFARKFSQISLCVGRKDERWLKPLSRSYYVYKDPNYRYHNLLNHKQKHYDPKFKKDRAQKFLKVELPNFDEEKELEEMTQEEIRAKMKEKGIQPVRPWMEKPLYLASTPGTFEEYVPPEGDGKISVTSKEGAKQKFEFLGQKGKSMMAVRKIRSFDDDFDAKEFAEEAQQIYIDSHKALAENDRVTLHQKVTERAFPLVTNQTKRATIRWQFIKSLEPPRVVHVRCTDVISKENVFAQVTVRFHTQQTLAVYDRFGRLQHGSEVVAKDVLEYVVFEKHIANTYGVWRVHDKIIPNWMPPRPPIRKTYRMAKEEEEAKPNEESESSEVTETDKQAVAVA